MARIRSMKPEMRSSRRVASWPMEARYFFSLLWGYLDDKGRGIDSPKTIAGDCFPWDEDITPKMVDGWLDLMTQERNGKPGPVCRYEVDGGTYLHCVNWSEHQKINRPTPSRLPSCPIHERGKQQFAPLTEEFSESLNENAVPGAGEQGSRGAGEVGTPPAAANARTQTREPLTHDDDPPGETERILASWIGGLKKRPLAKVVNDIGRIVAGALAEGQEAADVDEALKLWQRKGNLGANVLVSLIHEVANRQPSNVVALQQARASPQRESTTDARMRDGADVVAKFEALERAHAAQ